MGLDMYLYANSKTLAEKLAPYTGFGMGDFTAKNGIVAYWRKANAVHKWFVDNVQGGNDDCGLYRVSVDDLITLKKTCEEVLEYSRKNGLEESKTAFYNLFEDGKVVQKPCLIIKDSSKAEELLPTQTGFFFGETEYTEFYLQDLEHTISVIETILNNITNEGMDWDFEYCVKGEPDWIVEFTYHSSW